MADKLRVMLADDHEVEGGGVEACREIRDLNPEAEVVMLTSFSDDEVLFNSIMAGAAQAPRLLVNEDSVFM